MSVIIGGVYETQSGAFLRLVSQSDFILASKIDKILTSD